MVLALLAELLNQLMQYEPLTFVLLQSGPMVPGLPPHEASERLAIYQAQFDELWNKYQTYSGGERLFGLHMTDYPSLQTVRKELGLLQKLYGLYNTVIDTVDGYYDILWTEVDIEKINNELIDFQNRYLYRCKHVH